MENKNKRPRKRSFDEILDSLERKAAASAGQDGPIQVDEDEGILLRQLVEMAQSDYSNGKPN